MCMLCHHVPERGRIACGLSTDWNTRVAACLSWPNALKVHHTRGALKTPDLSYNTTCSECTPDCLTNCTKAECTLLIQ